MKIIKTILAISIILISNTISAQDKPLKLGIAGLSHAHVWEVISRIDRGDFEICGIAEKNTALWDIKALKNKLSDDLFFEDINQMLDQTKPEAVIVYESINDHLRIIEACAPRGIHVMVEKPLATNSKQARRIAELIRKYNILVLTNYETTWYASNHKAYELAKQEKLIGNISRINVYDGHGGPIEIGCGPEFTDWLTDPIKNGGGAVIDFGCYGANLSTWMMNGQKPISVYANLKQHKPKIYPKVDDDATIVLEYTNTTSIIMASWNWPMNRKDMHIYGNEGYIYQDDPTHLRVYQNKKENPITATPLTSPYDDPFHYLKAAVRGEVEVKSTDLSSLENNLIVVEILEAATKSAKTGKIIKLNK